MKSRRRAALAFVFMGVCGCAGIDSEESPGTADLSLKKPASGKHLFRKETFGGNGRTCATCHGDDTGTLSHTEAAERYQEDPNDPLFLPLDSDDGAGNSYTRLTTHATVLVTLPLPPNVSLADDPAKTTVTVERTIPSTLDVPALDPVLMWDGRVATLEEQAAGAIVGHAEAPAAPSDGVLEAIAEYEQEKLFSSKKLEKYAKGKGPAPSLPEGCSDSEIRGRAFFDPNSASLCGKCHSGPMLNEVNAFSPAPQGSRFANVRISTFNKRNLPVYTFLFETAAGTVTVQSPDPGRALITGDPADANKFKIPTLWNIQNTAPYFHDGSAKTLEEVVDAYAAFFASLKNPTFLTPQDKADIVAYLKLL